MGGFSILTLSVSVGRVLAKKGRGLILWGRVSEQEGCGLTLFKKLIFPFFPFFPAFWGGSSILTFSVSPVRACPDT